MQNNALLSVTEARENILKNILPLDSEPCLVENLHNRVLAENLYARLSHPAEAVSAMDERMPVIFDNKMEDTWLNESASEKELLDVLIPYPASKISAYTVSPRINDPQNEHVSLILPTPSSDQHGNLTLFD